MGDFTQGALESLVGGVAVEIIKQAGRRLSLAAETLKTTKNNTLQISQFFDTYSIVDSLELPSPPKSFLSTQITEWLSNSDVHAILHGLLAARLSNAPESAIEMLQSGFRKTLSAYSCSDNKDVYADSVFQVFDQYMFSMMESMIEFDPSILAAIRSEAHFSRITSTLQAIERHLETLNSQPDPVQETTYWRRYRRQVTKYHGKLEPPDFQRRRRVPIEKLYVSPNITPESVHRAANRNSYTHGGVSESSLIEKNSITIDHFSSSLDRAVLLGDPGGGKTTATHYLMNQYASNEDCPTPFLLILRDLASEAGQIGSILSHLELRISAFYQCQTPTKGALDRLLLNGSALVIFDGLDELIDGSLRADIASMIELFCSQYPLCRVLVTSRRVGYNQARLDDSQFSCWGISGFDSKRVSDYVSNWFAQEEGLTRKQASDYTSSFIAESRSVSDLTRNPLMLSLMCIVYRGEGYIPRNRAEVYGQCARLLFVKWDTSRGIHVELRARSLIEPAIRLLAFWLFARTPSGAAVTERELTIKVTEFLHGRGFETEEDARAAADEFIKFCRGRAWVFSDAGVTPRGEDLYTFTHRTFLEYFAAYHLATSCDTPEGLAKQILPHVARQEWEVVAQLAVQIKDTISDRGADRICEALLRNKKYRSAVSQANILNFIAGCMEIASHSPATARSLVRRITKEMFSDSKGDIQLYEALGRLTSICGNEQLALASEFELWLDGAAVSNDRERIISALRVALWLGYEKIRNIRAPNIDDDNWIGVILRARKTLITSSLEEAPDFVGLAIPMGILKVNELISATDGDLTGIFTSPFNNFTQTGRISMASEILRNKPEGTRSVQWERDLFDYLESANSLENSVQAFRRNEIFAQPFILNRIHAKIDPPIKRSDLHKMGEAAGPSCYLVAVAVEIAAHSDSELLGDRDLESLRGLGIFSQLVKYVQMRLGEDVQNLPQLPISDKWQNTLLRWAQGDISFVVSSSS
ncbi:NACHT domain-containing protein [Streptosporangium sp. NPDC023963]|uniref:NACHT domain-containing protein n=1 Tax=Streptosporangium sp. NPDC023963 TaxID=3155608 RepID=UPI0034430AD6